MSQEAEYLEEEEDEADNNSLVRNFILLALVLAFNKKKNQSRFINRLNFEGYSRRRRSLLRESLPPPSEAPWEHVYQCKEDGAMITVTGFDHKTFQYLLE